MTPLEWLAAGLGVSIVGLILVGLRRGEFDTEKPKYDMLGLPTPEPESAVVVKPGKLSPTDRITRLGLIGACFYYASRVGWGDPVGIVLVVVGTYAALTGFWGKDPFYLLWHQRKRK